jgi:adenylate kinase
MGPQGAGKGTVAAILKDKLNVPHISMGDIFRETVKSDTPLGNKLKEIMEKGELVPLEITGQMLKERLSKPDAKGGYLLDGYPRNVEQAEVLDAFENVNKVVVLEVPRSVSIDRLTSRIQCRDCGAVYNLKSMPPKNEGICDKCGGELYQRDDDKKEAIEKRLKIYEQETTPLMNRYETKLLRIDTSARTIDETVETILSSIS